MSEQRVAMTIINPRKEYWPNRRSNQRPPVLKSSTQPTEPWGRGESMSVLRPHIDCEICLPKPSLTLSQTTNFRLFQIRYEQFLFPQWFQKTSTADTQKPWFLRVSSASFLKTCKSEHEGNGEGKKLFRKRKREINVDVKYVTTQEKENKSLARWRLKKENRNKRESKTRKDTKKYCKFVNFNHVKPYNKE